jgi:hypothetical protein
MAATAEKIEELEELEVPNGGIGDFVMEDDEAEAVYGKDDEDDEEFDETGIAQFPDIAKKMATYGRNEDKFLAHVAKGELVIPFQFLENEDTKKAIFDMLIEAGLEDPERYVVGGEGNSINPTTGLPEFFLGKIFRGIVGGVKKALKTVVNVVKKIAPIVLPLALAATGLGPIYGAAVGSGISTLLNGGDIGDALKSGLVAGATGAAYAGITGGGMKGVADALSNPSARFSQAFEGAKASFSNPSDGFFGEGKVFDKFRAPDLGTSSVTKLAPTTAEINTAGEFSTQTPQSTSVTTAGEFSNTPTIDTNINQTPPKTFMESVSDGYDTTTDYMFRGGKTNMEVELAKQQGGIDAVAAAKAAGVTDPIRLSAIAEAGAASAGPGMLARYGPSALAGTAIAAGAGAFEVPEQEPVNLAGRNPDGTVITGSDLIDADPSKYLIGELGNLRLNPETGEYEEVESMVSSFNQNTRPFEDIYATTPMPNNMGRAPSGPFARPYVQAAAEGGPIFPRRNGGIAPTEGVAGQDSVRAMLMPGEFVMTTDAVRGLGNGNLNSGIQNMYSVMRNLESRGRNTA